MEPLETLEPTDPRAEFERLVADLCDDPSAATPTPTAAGHRLSALLREHPEWQSEFLDHLQLHALLRWRSGGAPAASAAQRQAEPAPRAADRSAARPTARPTERQGGRSRWRALAVGSSMAAAVAVAVVLALFVPVADAQAGPEVVGQLVDWNLDIAQAGSPDARRTVHDARAADMQTLVAERRLLPADRELADALIETGSWLTRNDDPVAEAERFADLADRMLVRLDTATALPDEQRAVKLAEAYQRLARVGVAGNLDRIGKAGPTDPHRKRRLDRVIAGHAGRAQKLEEWLAGHPEPSHKAIHRALKGHPRKFPGP